jgi:hypothetical protein
MSSAAIIPSAICRLERLKTVAVNERVEVRLGTSVPTAIPDELYQADVKAKIVDTTTDREIGKVDLIVFFPAYDSQSNIWDCESVGESLIGVLGAISDELDFLARFILKTDDIIRGPFAYLDDFEMIPAARGSKLGAKALKALYSELYKVCDLSHIFALPGDYNRHSRSRVLRKYFKSSFRSELVEEEQELVEIPVWRECERPGAPS